MHLLLREKFGDCKFINTSTCRANSSFEFINHIEFYIFDPIENQPVRLANKLEPYQLTVLNSKASEISLVKTDKCLFTDDYSKCDCLIFNDEKFFLIEIKNSSTGSRGVKRKTAVDQLSATLNTLIENNINLNKHSTKAIICFKNNRLYPVKASFNTQRAMFMEKYNVSLEEGNVIEF
jgi:hypothetical protein